MATYAIGDVQGCFEPLQRLLSAVAFDRARDGLWFVGDLVNRGPDSLAVLRYVRALGEGAITVLGNHDLHLLCVAEGYAKLHRSDTLDEVLGAADRDELLSWLRHRPLLHRARGYTMVHAGLLPGWTLDGAASLAREVEATLQGAHYREFLRELYGNRPNAWSDDLTGMSRLRMITNAMTRLRICTPEGVMEFAHKSETAAIPAGYLPWYEVPGRLSRGEPIVCGHWSALGLKLLGDLLALDSGCLWGRCLSAVRLEDRQLFQVSCAELAGQAVMD